MVKVPTASPKFQPQTPVARGPSAPLLLRAQTIFREKLFDARVRIKWEWDRFRLPLRPEHYNLYWVIHDQFHRDLACFPDLVRCRDFNEKIQWLKLFDQDERIPLCMDKVRVRDYVKSRVDDRYLVRLYQVADRLEDICLADLPQSFALKVNNDSGGVYLVRDKSTYDPRQAAHKISQRLNQVYGWEKGEWGYAFIKPKVLAEEYLDPTSPVPPADYKIHCINGRFCLLQYIYDRGVNTGEEVIDTNGNSLGYSAYFAYRGPRFSKPANWEEMISVAESIASGFKYVRVDLFSVNGRIYFGEMTFWPMAGCYGGDGHKRMSPFLEFDRTTVKPPIYQRSHMAGYRR